MEDDGKKGDVGESPNDSTDELTESTGAAPSSSHGSSPQQGTVEPLFKRTDVPILMSGRGTHYVWQEGRRRRLIQLSSSQLHNGPRWEIVPTSSPLEDKEGKMATKLLVILKLWK